MQFNGQNYVQDKDGGWVITDAPVMTPKTGQKVAAVGLPLEAQQAADIAALKAKDTQDVADAPKDGKKYGRINGAWIDLALGLKADLVTGKVPTSQLPSLVAQGYVAPTLLSLGAEPADPAIQNHLADASGNPHGTALTDLYTAPTIADSVATDITALVADFNALLASLRTAGILTA